MLITAGLLLACAAVFALGSEKAESIKSSENQSRPVNWEQRSKEHEIERDLCKAVISWLADGNDLAALECDRLVDSLLATGEPTVRAYFIAASVANLRNKPRIAISSLEKAIEKYPDDKAPIRIHIPTKIIGCFWIANIAKQSGEIKQAQSIYKTLLSILSTTENVKGVRDKVGLIMLCQFYLAEIESEQLQNNQKALSHLKAIEEVEKPTGLREHRGAGYDLCKSWANYESTRITRGTGKANLELSPVSEPMSAYILAVQHLLITGISGEPLVGSRKGMNIMMYRLIDRAIQSKYSKVDKDLAMLGYGYDQHYRGNFEKAEELFSSLFQRDSFFSPVAGISLAQVKKAKGKTAEAEATLERLITKYPGYKSLAVKVKESWKNNAEKIKM